MASLGLFDFYMEIVDIVPLDSIPLGTRNYTRFPWTAFQVISNMMYFLFCIYALLLRISRNIITNKQDKNVFVLIKLH